MGDFAYAVTSLRANLAEHPLAKGVISSDQAVRGFKAAMDAALGRGSQALTNGSRTPSKKAAKSSRLAETKARTPSLQPMPLPITT
jgi:hypothetical protein